MAHPSIKAVALTLIKRPSRRYFLPLRGTTKTADPRLAASYYPWVSRRSGDHLIWSDKDIHAAASKLDKKLDVIHAVEVDFTYLLATWWIEVRLCTPWLPSATLSMPMNRKSRPPKWSSAPSESRNRSMKLGTIRERSILISFGSGQEPQRPKPL